jgi:hypothetical protein
MRDLLRLCVARRQSENRRVGALKRRNQQRVFKQIQQSKRSIRVSQIDVAELHLIAETKRR